jgi:hypothetical protein
MGANAIELETLLSSFQFFLEDLIHLFFKFCLGQGVNVIESKGTSLNYGSSAFVDKNGCGWHRIGKPPLKFLIFPRRSHAFIFQFHLGQGENVIQY